MNICNVESAAATKLPLVFDGAVPATAKNFFIGSFASFFAIYSSIGILPILSGLNISATK